MSQIGGKNSFYFLNIPTSARSSSLGGSSISLKETDPNLIYDNPATLDTSLDNHFSFNYINYISNVNAGSIQYVKRLKNVGALGFGVQFLGYGKFTGAQANGQKTGDFKAGDYAFNAGFGRSFDSVWSVGGNVKFIFSNYESYQRTALGLDLGANFLSRDQTLSSGISIKNMGASLKKNQSDERDNLPFEIQVGISKKIPKAPLRFHFQLRNMQKWDLVSKDPNFEGKTNKKTGEVKKTPWSAKNLMRHVVIGADIIPHKNFYLTLAYNHNRKKELAVNGRGSSGFSFGAGLKVKRLRFNYGFTSYFVSGTSHHIGISTNLNDYFSN